MRRAIAGAIALASSTLWAAASVADEGGVSFWLPGQNGSFAAVAPAPGWSLPLVFYNYGGLPATRSPCRAGIC